MSSNFVKNEMISSGGWILFCLVLAATISVINPTKAFAVEIQKVTSSRGVTALLVEDYTVPLVSVSFSFQGGSTQDPSGKEGQLRLLTSMLDEGAGELDSQAFQLRMEEVGVELGFSAGRDRVAGGMRTLVAEQENAFDLMRLALNEPRFDKKPLERIRAAYVASLKRSENNPRSKGGKALRLAAYGDHPYAKPGRGTEKTLNAITVDDLKTAHRMLFARSNLTVGVVGAITPADLKQMLDKVFGDLPEEAVLTEFEQAQLNLGQKISVEAQIPQASVTLVYPGVQRSDPDFFAAHLVNHILGGGTFSSRLYREIREKRGLAYSVSSNLSTFELAAAITSSTSTRADRLGEVIEIIKMEFQKMADEGPTVEEFALAKKFVIGTYAISNLDTSTKIASVLVGIQDSDLGLDYLDKREDYINSVTLEDAKRVASRLLSADPLVVTVGPKPSKTN